MKCPLCDGKGEYMHQCGGYRQCEHCNGTGKVDITNEDWFCSLPTEEKAKFFKNFNPCDKCPAQKICDTVRNCENSFLKWLKEKHHE